MTIPEFQTTMETLTARGWRLSEIHPPAQGHRDTYLMFAYDSRDPLRPGVKLESRELDALASQLLDLLERQEVA